MKYLQYKLCILNKSKPRQYSVMLFHEAEGNSQVHQLALQGQSVHHNLLLTSALETELFLRRSIKWD